MKRRKKHFKYKDALVILVWFLAFTLYFVYLFSGLGLVIAGKIGLSMQKINYVTGRCADVNIHIISFPMPARHVEPAEMIFYDFTLDNGCTYSTEGYYLKHNGITDAQLQALRGSEITVEYSELRFFSKSYAILSVSSKNGVIIPKEIAIQFLETRWKYTRNTLILSFGISGGLLLLCVIPIIKRKLRKRRKKARRAQQLMRRRQREEQTLQSSTSETSAPVENDQGINKRP